MWPDKVYEVDENRRGGETILHAHECGSLLSVGRPWNSTQLRIKHCPQFTKDLSGKRLFVSFTCSTGKPCTSTRKGVSPFLTMRTVTTGAVE
jgi:hypothetical protein